jgi:molybdopterin converting factor small subunit
MRVKIDYYGPLRAAAGRAHEEFDLSHPSTAGEVFHLACRLHPRMSEWAGRVLVTVGLDYVELSHQVKEGESLSFLPAGES